MIKNIIFDIGNVLIQFKPQEFLKEKYVDEKKCDELFKLIFKSEEWLMLDKGTITEEEAVERFSQRKPEYKNECAEIMRDWHDMHIPMKDTVELLKDLKNKGYEIFLLSNYHRKAFEVISDRFDFLGLANGKIISSHVQLLKPDKEIYEALLKNYNLKAEESVFIDDTLVNIEKANELGIHGIWFKNVKSLREELSKLDMRHGGSGRHGEHGRRDAEGAEGAENAERN